MSPAMEMKAESRENEDEDQILEAKYQQGVKHLCDNIGITRLPRKYILPISERPISTNAQKIVKCSNLPIIDFSQLQGSNRSQVLKALCEACEEYGLFQLVNHGIASDVLSSMRDVTRRFFELPYEERSQYMSADMGNLVRYGTSFNQNKDGVFCWRDFLKLTCSPLSDVIPHFPSFPLDFKTVAATYVKETKFLFIMLMEAILESLGLSCDYMNDTKMEEDDILKEFQDGSQLMVLNCYPPCPQPDLTLGMPPHSDYGFITLLLQEDVPGLQIEHDGNWITVEPIPNSLVVNLGDHLEIFSNGKYKSVLHRVIVNSLRSRITVASLHSLPWARTVRPWSRLINEANPKRYMDTDFRTFLAYITSCEPKKKNFLESRKLIT
ncbi:Isopenicillin N synthase-like, Fe(2+) 2OG dioxygenase domain [Dillenia turbinata]|uniref:Isopenicillin N synthase-like, Fe(2+) 2OG dioxygenase domain n=1 Tax=Dillenia turbinata TaxID=194707 RepID=A0AAN8W0S4_9MAGN